MPISACSTLAADYTASRPLNIGTEIDRRGVPAISNAPGSTSAARLAREAGASNDSSLSRRGSRHRGGTFIGRTVALRLPQKSTRRSVMRSTLRLHPDLTGATLMCWVLAGCTKNDVPLLGDFSQLFGPFLLYIFPHHLNALFS